MPVAHMREGAGLTFTVRFRISMSRSRKDPQAFRNLENNASDCLNQANPQHMCDTYTGLSQRLYQFSDFGVTISQFVQLAFA